MAERPVSSQRPYLLRAMHEWMVDNALTPHIVVDASSAEVNVPPENISEGKIVLNVSYAATRGLALGNDTVAFEARFNGVPRSVNVPVASVLGIYARETGQGMVFAEEAPTPPEDPAPDEDRRPRLKVVK
jgi:stringent starvation protein B